MADMEEGKVEKQYVRANISLSDIQPLSIFLPDEQKWMDEYEKGKEYFESAGLDNIHFVEGIHARKWGVRGTHIYLLDGRAEEQFYIGTDKVGCFLSWYILYQVMKGMGKPYYMILESDCRFVDGWKEKLEQSLKDVPEDFDFLFVGSCCATDKEPIHVAGDIYHFPYRGEDYWQYYPQCGHCYIINQKCVQILIDTQRDTASPVDVSLIKHAFPKLNIYAILPRLADQGTKTEIPA